MTEFKVWWQNVPKSQKPIWVILCYALILAGSIDVGRALYDVLH
ncbi:hypothetical protein DESA109040_13765 [Deinococcus saxicola]